jgi:hypothetical protein
MPPLGPSMTGSIPSPNGTSGVAAVSDDRATTVAQNALNPSRRAALGHSCHIRRAISHEAVSGLRR